MRLFDFISRGTCGDKRNLCKSCIQNIPKENHKCIYKHHYLIPQNIVTLAKQVKECSVESRVINMEKLIVDMQKQINKQNGESAKKDSFC